MPSRSMRIHVTVDLEAVGPILADLAGRPGVQSYEVEVTDLVDKRSTTSGGKNTVGETLLPFISDGMNVPQIVSAIQSREPNLGKPTIYSRLDAARKYGFVIKASDGTYSITEKGKIEMETRKAAIENITAQVDGTND